MSQQFDMQDYFRTWHFPYRAECTWVTLPVLPQPASLSTCPINGMQYNPNGIPLHVSRTWQRVLNGRSTSYTLNAVLFQSLCTHCTTETKTTPLRVIRVVRPPRLGVYHRFVQTCCLHFQDRFTKINWLQPSSQSKESYRPIYVMRAWGLGEE